MSELTFAAALANPKLRLIFRPYLKEIEWRSDHAKAVVEYLNSHEMTGKAEIGEMRAVLSNHCIDSEADRILTMIKEYIFLSSGKIEPTVAAFERFYHAKILEQTLRIAEGDSTKIIEGIKSIRSVAVETLPLSILGELDVPDVIKSELGNLDPIPSCFRIVREATPWGGYLRGQVILIVAPPGVGKSLYLANEAVNMLKEGYHIFWAALGDMMKLDFIIRFSSIILGEPLRDVSLNPNKFFNSSRVRSLTKNLKITVVPAGHIDIYSLRDFIDTHVVKSGWPLDAFFLDYDANLTKTNESSYLDSENTFNVLTTIARPLHSQFRLVMVAGQPNKFFWNLPELPMDCNADSSKKAMISDMMMTMGKESRILGSHAGIMRPVKCRRGNESLRTGYKVTSCGIIEELELDQYRLMMSVTAK